MQFKQRYIEQRIPPNNRGKKYCEAGQGVDLLRINVGRSFV